MINFALFKQGIKSNYKIMLIFGLLLIMYVSVIASMYDPKQASMLAEFYETMPEIMTMVGMSGDSTTLLGFLVTYLYGFLFIVIPIIIIIMLANKLVASHTDKGSMAYLLASPNNRTKIIFTQMKVLGTYIFSLVVFLTILTIIVCQSMFPGELEIGKLLILNLGLLVLHLAIGGICFISSCIFNETKNSLLFGAGIPIIFLLLQMLSNMGGKLDILKYFTVLTLFDPSSLIKGEINAYIMLGILIIIAVILYSLSIIIFKKKDLSV